MNHKFLESKKKMKKKYYIMTTRNFSVRYLAGILESDGTFLASFSEKALKVEIRFSQKSNTNLLSKFQSYLKEHKISSNIEEGSDNRAPVCRLQGFKNVFKLIQLLEKGNPSYVFTGVKQRDMLIMKRLVDPSANLTLAQKLSLAKSLHKSNLNEPDFTENNSRSRESFEIEFGLSPNQSIFESQILLESIDKEFNQHQLRLIQKIKDGSLTVDADYFAGVIDGDGYYGVAFRERKPRPHKGEKNPRLVFEPVLEVTMEIRSRTTLKVLQYAFQHPVTMNETKTGNGITFLLRNQSALKNVLKIHEIFPPIGDLRSQQLQTIIDFFDLKNKSLLKTSLYLENFMNKLYDVSALSQKGRGRKLSREEALELVRKYCQK